MNNSYTVQTNTGPISGKRKTSILSDKYVSFRGIPYAKAPVGDLRFKDPQPIDPWTTTFQANKDGPSAVQGDDGADIGDTNEDCLYLNVYSKNLKPIEPLPVLIWIHGGAFRVGSGSENMFSPDYLLQKDIVYVSLNYRLGVLGFLSIDDQSVGVPGNAALKDQTLALKWIRENIKSFGGDPANITVMGSDSGATCIHTHMLSKHSEGLFDKAIIMSGTVPNIKRNSWAQHLAKQLGWNEVGGSRGCYEFLKQIDPTELMKQEINLKDSFGPCLEPYEAEKSFFTESNSSCWGYSIPIIIGCTSDEGLLFYRELSKDSQCFDEQIESLVPNKKLVDKLKNHYYGEENLNNIRPKLKLLGDRFYTYAVHSTVKARLAAKSSATFVYRFNFQSKTGFNSAKDFLSASTVGGVCHGEDLAYLFKTSQSNMFKYNSIEHRIVDNMVGSFVNFAESGDPNGEAINQVTWYPATDTNSPRYKVLNISDKLQFIDLPESESMELFDLVFRMEK